MRFRPLATALMCAGYLLTNGAARPDAHGVARRLDSFVGADRLQRFASVATDAPVDSHVDESFVDPIALLEMLEGTQGRRETWMSTPTLVVVTSALDYEHGDLATGFPATGHRLSPQDIAELSSDLTTALGELTDGRLSAFREVIIETVEPGQMVQMFRPGHIVVSRFRGLREVTGNLGYGGRATRRSGAISGAAVMLDDRADGDQPLRRLVRTHELGHALGYNHVVSAPSIMNPRVGSALSDFDRAAIRQAVPQAFGLN